MGKFVVVAGDDLRLARLARIVFPRGRAVHGALPDMAAASISGILSPHMVPLDDRGQIAEPELRRHVSWLIDRGIHGLYPNGSTGEFLRFTVEERRRITAIVCDEARGRVPVVAGAAEANVTETIRACEAALAAGARAVAVVSPFYYRLSPANVLAYFREIGRQSPIDVTLYNIPMLASPIDVPTVRRLAEEFPRIIGIKDSSGDVSHMMRLIAAVRPVRPDFAFLTGWDPALVPMLAAGCDGGTHATSNVAPELTRAIFDAFRAGRHDAARRMQHRLTELFDALFAGIDFPEGFRAGSELRGFRMGASRQPLADEQRAERGRVADRVRGLLEKLGVNINEPERAASLAGVGD
jgi:4-hydroxy-tetrahydrodipicolinate synthase